VGAIVSRETRVTPAVPTVSDGWSTTLTLEYGLLQGCSSLAWKNVNVLGDKERQIFGGLSARTILQLIRTDLFAYDSASGGMAMAGRPKQSPDAARSRTRPVAGKKTTHWPSSVVAGATRGAGRRIARSARRGGCYGLLHWTKRAW